MPFGKYKGSPLHEIPSDYLLWVLGNVDDLRNGLDEAIRIELRARATRHYNPFGTGGSSHSSSRGAVPPQLDSTMALLIVKAGRQQLALRWHPDRGGDLDQMQKLNRAADEMESWLRGVQR